MAEESGKKREEASVKLFVGQVPKHMTEPQLLSFFTDLALAVDEVNLIKDKLTRSSRGCCFVMCPTRQEADKAVSACHNKKLLPGASSPLQVKYADGELERLGAASLFNSLELAWHMCSANVDFGYFCRLPLTEFSSCPSVNNLLTVPCNPEHKLFVGMLPKNVSEAEVSDLFSNYGTVKELQILRGSQQTSKGCAFLKYETKEQALAAIEAVSGKHKMEGSGVPLIVKWADTEKERQARRGQKTQYEVPNMLNADSQNHSLFGALPMGYAPPYNGYGYQTHGGYGLMQYRLPPMQNQPGFHNQMVHPVNQGNALQGITPDLAPNTPPRNYTMPPASYAGSSYPAVPGTQYPMAYPGGMINHRSLSGSPSSVPPAVSSNSATSSGASSSSGGQIEGPPGANLFIYHIPQEFGDQELSNSFQAFGLVLSAKVFVDKATGLSKCFGFVSYDSPAAAQTAISMMNGYQLGGKKLKVQLKRDNKQNKTY